MVYVIGEYQNVWGAELCGQGSQGGFLVCATMRRFCASLHRRRGAPTSRDPAPNFRVVSVICDRVPLTRGYHAGVHSRSHTFAHSR